MSDLEPPRPLSIASRQMFDRHAARVHEEGRWSVIDHDALATYCETVELYLACKRAVDEHGVLVRGRTEHERVKNPALTPMNQARAAATVLAKAIPLTNPDPDHSGAAIDSWLKEMCADE